MTKAEWLEKNGFAEDGTTWVIVGNTYPIKEEIKQEGGKFNKLLGWHSPDLIPIQNVYFFCLEFDEVYAWNTDRMEVEIKNGAEELVKKATQETLPASKSEFVGSEKERIRDIPVTLTNVYGTEGMYGYKTIFTFETEEGSIIRWSTTACREFNIGDKFLLTGTVKSFYTSNLGEKITYFTRCLFKEV